MTLPSKRNTLKQALISVLRWAKEATDKVQLSAAEKALLNLEEKYNSYEAIHNEILAITGESEMDFQQIEFDDTTRTYNEARSRILELVERIRNRPSTSKGSLEADLDSSNDTQDVFNSPIVVDSQPTWSPKDSSNIIARNAAAAIQRLSLRAEKANASESANLIELLSSYWTTYSNATFADWTSQIDDTFGEVEDNFMKTRSHLSKLLEASRQTQKSISNAETPSVTKLPPIPIPKFNGNVEQWSSFHDLFNSMVHNKNNISNVQKMHYLRACLEGEAENLIRSYNVTDANYEEAWDVLNQRYNQKRIIINAHMDKFLNLSKSVTESADALRHLVNTFTDAVRALKALNEPTNGWPYLIVFLLVSKLDPKTKHDWEMTLGGNDIPTFEQLVTFLERRYRALEANGKSSSSSSNTKLQRITPVNNSRLVNTQRSFSTTTKSKAVCLLCKGDHYIFSCPDFILLSPGERYNQATVLKLCFNCLRADHHTKVCENGTCRKCGGRHHSLLHYKNYQGPQTTSTTQAAHLGTNINDHQVLLATAIAHTIDINKDHQHQLRILLDSGSQCNFVTESFVKRTGLLRSKAHLPVSGVAKTAAGTTRGHVEFYIKSHQNIGQPILIQAFILQCITGYLPNNFINKNQINFLAKIPALADPHFDTPGEIDVLLGSRILGSLLLDGKIHDCRDKSLFAQETTLGWVIAGPIPNSKACNLRTMVSHLDQINLDNALQRFWELESYGSSPMLTTEEKDCEDHFASTHHRLEDGRFMVELPFRQNIPSLGNSKTSAIKSLQHLERRLAKDPELKLQYSQFIEEYISLGHMSLVEHPIEDHRSFYLPHHPVFKPSSTSTKMRVVFDASRKTSTGTSLNDKLMVGPKLQKDLVDILLRFRRHAIAFCGDLVKMYRQVRTTPTSSEYQRILWRTSPHHPIQTYRLDTVTYGTASASYLATKALKQLATDEKERFPLACATALDDFYMDDLMTGADNIPDALVLQKQMILLMESGGFCVSKWASNSNPLLESVPENQREINCPLDINIDATIKTLGLTWNPCTDCFIYRINLPSSSPITTKRSILSEVASLFDPLGLLAPLIVAAKIFLQALWAEGVGWDQTLPAALAIRWQQYREALPVIHALQIPRWLGIHPTHSYQLHGFCDASEAAYAAVVYLRSTDPSKNTTIHIITAKSKVAPIKKISLPRLELCGAVLLARLISHLKESLNQPQIECHAWCDSTITLAWIRKPSHHWQTFVANRVSAIQSLVAPEIWHHISGIHNPADAASRGLSASALLQSNLWWNGPDWLSKSNEHWPITHVECTTNIDAKPPSTIALLTSNDTLGILERFSSLDRLLRVTVLLRRFIFNARNPKPLRIYGSITTEELEESKNHWVRVTQETAFFSEISHCRAGTTSNQKGTLATLAPFLDDSGILRVGGRIHKADIPFNSRHPIILPKISHLSQLLVANTHIKNLHSGPQLTINTIRQQYWIVSIRSIVKQFIHRCPVCIRYKQTRGHQFMATLPEHRTQSTRAFLVSGVDYAGPLTIKLQPGRGTKLSKAYIALFVCFSTKAIHLELVSSLTTDAFIAAFRRFVARRGRCSHLHSDCGTNFIGADKELRSLHSEIIQQFKSTSLANRLSTEGTQWSFNPPGAPSFGGIWEAGVKSVKHHLRRILGTSLLTFEEMYTTLAQIEATLNSRPIGPMSDDVNDFQPLTPGHFLIGEPMNSVPDPTTPIKIPILQRWKHLQQLNQHFWQRWRQEYITTLQERHKWTKRNENISIGRLALITDETLPPARWALGRIVETHPGSDGLVRVVTLRHQYGLIKRPITKLVLFPNINEK